MNEFSTLTWAHVREWASKEVERLRQRNDSIELDREATCVLRGEIRALKRLLALPEEVARKPLMEPSGNPTATVL